MSCCCGGPTCCGIEERSLPAVLRATTLNGIGNCACLSGQVVDSILRDGYNYSFPVIDLGVNCKIQGYFVLTDPWRLRCCCPPDSSCPENWSLEALVTCIDGDPSYFLSCRALFEECLRTRTIEFRPDPFFLHVILGESYTSRTLEIIFTAIP